MPTIDELPEPSGGPPPSDRVEDTPPPETAADSGIMPGGADHIEFIGTLFGSPEPEYVVGLFGVEELAPGEEFNIDWDWVRMPLRAGDHVTYNLDVGDNSSSLKFRGPGLRDDPESNNADLIASGDGEYYFVVSGEFARVDTLYTLDIWINTTTPADLLA